MKIKKTTLRFNLREEFPLNYGHYLRGYFANRFSEILFHNHKEDGSFRYGYPLIQYKIVDGCPTIVGLEKGAKLISQYFLDIDEINLKGKVYTNFEKQLSVNEVEHTFAATMKYKYQFLSPWMALSQKNYKKYTAGKDSDQFDNNEFLQKLLVGNILSYAKSIDWWVDKQIFILPKLEERIVQFKGEKMIGFVGQFHSNLKLPDLIGLGNSTSRGFGTIRLLDK